MVRAATKHGLTHRVGVIEFVTLAQVADQQSAGLRDATLVRNLVTRQQSQKRGLAIPVSADDADPITHPDPEGHFSEQWPDAVRLGNPLQVDQIAHGYLTRWAPATGPFATSTTRCGPPRAPATSRA